MAKVDNFNVPVEKEVAVEFETWANKVSGKKGDKLTAAIKAVQAIYEIDRGLYFDLTNPAISINKAKELITKYIIDKKKYQILDKYSPAQQDLLLEIAEETPKRLARLAKKK